MSIGERIKKVRKDKDLTQQEFGEKIGSTQNAIGNYETGHRNPSASVINNICKTFGVNEEWLRDGTGEIYQPEATAALELLAIEHNLTNGEYVLIEKFLKLKPDVRTALVCYVREVAASIVNDEADGLYSEAPVMPDVALTGMPLTDDDIKGRATLYTEIAQQSAHRELQRAGVDPEIGAEVEAYRQRRIQEKKKGIVGMRGANASGEDEEPSSPKPAAPSVGKDIPAPGTSGQRRPELDWRGQEIDMAAIDKQVELYRQQLLSEQEQAKQAPSASGSGTA